MLSITDLLSHDLCPSLMGMTSVILTRNHSIPCEDIASEPIQLQLVQTEGVTFLRTHPPGPGFPPASSCILNLYMLTYFAFLK